MTLEWEQVVFDAGDPATLGRWWADALGWTVVNDSPEEYEIQPEAGRMPGMMFVPVADGKTAKNRVHPDFRPVDQQAEVERLLGLGARRADIGQGDAPWQVLLDPEGNEFCVLSSPAK